MWLDAAYKDGQETESTTTSLSSTVGENEWKSPANSGEKMFQIFFGLQLYE